jgi:hypothetical protein
MVSLVLDATANIAMFAIAAHADEREAHVRGVERCSQNLPEGSCGRRNRQAIAAARETRIAAQLRAIEQVHRIGMERDTVLDRYESTRACRTSENAGGGTEIELDIDVRVRPD